MLNYLKFLIILLLTKHCWTKGNNYVIVADENSFFQPCSPEDNAGNKNMEDLLELNLKHHFADDMETLITNGNITMKFGVPLGVMIELDMEIFQWKRAECWYSLTSQIAQEDRVCPPKEGTVYHLNNVENRVELNNVDSMDIEGNYKIISHFSAGNYASCITALVTVWKN
ncbi:uncharacterized protein LOC119600585 isoform X2 [Lucilia sericata]|uniref:uncharacterized protein LOC119600585 isoform X2 n=1 Tax=Lucilia sericata TaxID=13632 RepID=UPI0018A8163A|nr:uncharacterized protein LOC119600585 isoform X2 [Lucilia sericata]